MLMLMRRFGGCLIGVVLTAVSGTGGKVSENGAHLAEPLGSVPAKKIPELLAQAQLAHSMPGYSG